MLKLLDKYIIKKFLSTFFFMLGIIMLLAMVFDISDRLGEFIAKEAPVSEIIFTYYFNFILFYGNSFSFMIIFISVIWFTAKMAQETEIIPILNSGKPFSRFIRPYMIAATILVVISLFINHIILPTFNKRALDFEDKYYRNSLSVSNYFADFPGNITIQFGTYTAEENKATQFIVQRFNKDNTLAYILVAASAENIEGTDKWIFRDYYERTVGYPKDVLREGKQLDTIFQFRINEMATRDNISSAMRTGKLRKFIMREKEKGSSKVPLYELELYQRTANPFATYILTIIGIAVSSQKKRGGIGVNIAIGLSIVLVYIFAMKIMAVAAENVGFPTIIAAWMPNVLFSFVAAILYKFAQK
ncbi:MAG: LptF/LptG family permease [Crocinitomicaceae bacterium]|nr:LptF/LptG family permease [Crocinitomicaceae bacterium]